MAKKQKQAQSQDWQSVVFYRKWAEMLQRMPADLRHAMHDLFDQYIINRSMPKEDNPCYWSFYPIAQQIETDRSKYNRIREQNADNARKRWERLQELEASTKIVQSIQSDAPVCDRIQSDAPVCDRIQSDASVTDNDIDCDNDNGLSNDNNKETTNVAKKARLSLELKMKKRMDDFKDSIAPFVETYGRDMCNEFFLYWTETNKTKAKMRFELQKTWDVKRRLSRWSRNNFNHHGE